MNVVANMEEKKRKKKTDSVSAQHPSCQRSQRSAQWAPGTRNSEVAPAMAVPQGGKCCSAFSLSSRCEGQVIKGEGALCPLAVKNRKGDRIPLQSVFCKMSISFPKRHSLPEGLWDRSFRRPVLRSSTAAWLLCFKSCLGRPSSLPFRLSFSGCLFSFHYIYQQPYGAVSILREVVLSSPQQLSILGPCWYDRKNTRLRREGCSLNPGSATQFFHQGQVC